MMTPSVPIIGSCVDMCPKSEVAMRMKEKLLHRLELGPDYQPVKEFTRSAAGHAEELPSAVRPPQILQATVTYLFNTIVTKDRSLEVFTFVSNRLRAVKQDLFKQQCSASLALPILEPIVRYYAWAAFWYCEEPAFEQHLHELLLLECIKECLRLSNKDELCASDDIEALYVLYTLGLSNGIVRAADVLATRRSPLLYLCMIISLQWFLGNYTAVCKGIQKLPPLLSAFVSVKHLEAVRKYGLKVMSTSYCCKNLVTPWEALQHMFNDKVDAVNACKFYSLTFDDKGVIFSRTSAFKNDQRKFRKAKGILQRLESVSLPNIFFDQ